MRVGSMRDVKGAAEVRCRRSPLQFQNTMVGMALMHYWTYSGEGGLKTGLKSLAEVDVVFAERKG